MGLKCGIVGLPNVGKSTLFNCLTNTKALAANFPFCTIEPNFGVITVPDERLTKLAALVRPQKVIPASVEIVDIAGLVKGASNGEGLGNQFLANIRECHAVIHLLRCFEDDNVAHVDGSVNPVRDKEVVDTELQLKDLETIEKKIYQLEKRGQTGGDKGAKKAITVFLKYKKHLGEGKPARSLNVTGEEKEIVAGLNLLTEKPVLYVCNVHLKSESSEAQNRYTEQLKKIAEKENAGIIFIDARKESEIAALEKDADRKMFLSALGIEEPAMNKLIKATYNLLNQITFFTAGEKQVRAWTITDGMTASQAAGIIHTDFEKGFIRAEVIRCDDYIRLGSENACREAGKLNIEGKEYLVQDGDVIHFRFNV